MLRSVKLHGLSIIYIGNVCRENAQYSDSGYTYLVFLGWCDRKRNNTTYVTSPKEHKVSIAAAATAGIFSANFANVN
jgi:hypothetical protein